MSTSKEDTTASVEDKIIIEPRALTEKQTSDYTNFSRSYFRQDRMNGRRKGRTPGAPFLKNGRAIRYLKDDLDTPATCGPCIDCKGTGKVLVSL